MKDLLEQGKEDETTRIIHDMILDGEVQISDIILNKF